MVSMSSQRPMGVKGTQGLVCADLLDKVDRSNIFTRHILLYVSYIYRQWMNYYDTCIDLDFKYSYAGFPSSEIPANLDPTPELLWTWISGLLYNPILALVKTSALVFMIKLAGHFGSVRWSIYVGQVGCLCHK